MNEKSGPESFIDPSILADMTPEGRKLAKKVLESTDMVIRVVPTRQMKPDTPPLHPVIQELTDGLGFNKYLHIVPGESKATEKN